VRLAPDEYLGYCKLKCGPLDSSHVHSWTKQTWIPSTRAYSSVHVEYAHALYAQYVSKKCVLRLLAMRCNFFLTGIGTSDNINDNSRLIKID
jgi:hypothetical protein